jgi:hypothetical protein
LKARKNNRNTLNKKHQKKPPKARFFEIKNFVYLLPDEICHHLADEVRPKNNGDNRLPEGQVQKANREKPSRKPGKCREAVIFDLYFFHILILPFKKIFVEKFQLPCPDSSAKIFL